jgi:secreted trypsin-like serine protease
MRRSPRLFLSGTLVALGLLAPATALAQSGGSVQPRIVGGTTASVSTYPWQAAVVYSTAQSPNKNPHQRQFCGGSLLTSRIVITAAHCVADTDPDCSFTCALNDQGGDGTAKIDPNDVDVILGRSTLTDTGQGTEHSVTAVVPRSNYDPDYQGDGVPRYDVAYLVLSSASAQTPIKIAGTDEGALWDPGRSADISGWGSTSENGNTVDTLRSATVGVIADPTCGSASVYGSDFDPATMVCAGYMAGGVDTCYGDSGGPLEAPLEGGGYRLVGITGWGEGCAEAGFPGVYTRVAGPTMRSLIASDVSSLDTTYGLAAEEIFGGGGQPQGGTALAAGTSQPAETNGRKRCKRIHNRKKRKRCIKRAKALTSAQSLN